MKNLTEYIFESPSRDWDKKFKKFKKSISKEDMQLFLEIANDSKSNSSNTLRSAEEIEQLFWKGEYKDKVDEIFSKISEYLNKAGSSANEVCDRYSLARSGKQYKIEVSAQMIYFLNTR